jgi:hypothetical protein
VLLRGLALLAGSLLLGSAPESSFPKRCSCGRVYTAAMWRRLPGGKLWKLPWGEVQEMRDCVCGSTMNVVLVQGDPE